MTNETAHHTPGPVAGDRLLPPNKPAVRMGITQGPWRWRHVYDVNKNQIAMLLGTLAPNQPHNDPVVLALREDWIGYLTRTEAGRANAALIVRAPTLLAENDVLRSRIYEMEIMITQAVGAANGSLVQAKEGEPAFMPLLRAALGAKGGE